MADTVTDTVTPAVTAKPKAKPKAKAKPKPKKAVKKAVKKPTKTDGRKSGSTNFSPAELDYMLNILENILPIGPDEWNEVAQELYKRFPIGRDALAIRRKFMALHRRTGPTGDPNCPPEVIRAKKIKRMIGVRAETCDGQEDFDILTGGWGGRPPDITLGQPT